MSKVFSIKGKGLKLHSAEDAKPHIDALKAIQGLEEVHLGGNTLGVEACEAFGEALKSNQTLKVGLILISFRMYIDYRVGRRPVRYIYRPVDNRDPSSPVIPLQFP